MFGILKYTTLTALGFVVGALDRRNDTTLFVFPRSVFRFAQKAAEVKDDVKDGVVDAVKEKGKNAVLGKDNKQFVDIAKDKVKDALNK